MIDYLDLNNRPIRVNPRGCTMGSENASAGHVRCRRLLHALYPGDLLLEEVPIPVMPRRVLYADFLLPGRLLMVEVHGRQHYEETSFFHKDKTALPKQQVRDKLKLRFCQINELTYIELPDSMKDEEWLSILRGDN